MRLERPFVFGLDHPRRRFEGVVDIADRLALFALAHRRLADVIVERRLIGERRRNLRPLDLELPRRLDRIPFLVGDDAEEALVPDHLGARDILDRASSTFTGTAPATGGRIMRPCTMPGTLMSVTKSACGKDLRRDVVARNRLADDLVGLRIFRLRLAGRVERIAVFAVPVEMDVEELPADQLGVADLLGRHRPWRGRRRRSPSTDRPERRACRPPSRPARGALRRRPCASACRPPARRSSRTRRPD